MRIVLLFLIISTKIFASEIEFIPNDLSLARMRAQQEGKLVLVKFYADWCLPCKVMDESTWPQPAVVSYVDEHCVAAKINYDDAEGIAYRNYFNVDRLPTILILDVCGNEVARMENGASSDVLLQWISMFNTPENRRCEEGNMVALPNNLPDNQNLYTKPAVEDATAQVEEEAALPEVAVPKPLLNNGPALQEVHAVAPQQAPDGKQAWRKFRRNKNKIVPDDSEEIVYEKPIEELKTRPIEPITYHNEVPVPEERPMMSTIARPVVEREQVAEDRDISGIRTSEFVVPLQGYSVQVIACTSERNAEEMKQKCLQVFGRPVGLIAPEVAGDSFYHVVVGHFSEKSEAARFGTVVRQTYKTAFVKNLSSF